MYKLQKNQTLLILIVFLILVPICSIASDALNIKSNKNFEKESAELYQNIMDEKFIIVENFINHAIENKRTTKDGILYFKALLQEWFFSSEVLEFNRPKVVSENIFPKINKWIKSNPNSEIPLIIRGVFYIEKAWEIRSRRWAKDVKKQNWPRFKKLHELAKLDLEKAYELNPNNPHSSRQLIRVQRVINARDYEKTEVYFRRAIKNHPNFFWAYRAKLENMMPKWGGNWNAMFAFAKEVSSNPKPKTLLPLVYAYALEEVANRSPNEQQFLNQPQVWNAFEQIYTQIIRDFPNSALWRVRYSQIAKAAGKDDLALEVLIAAQKIDASFFRIYEEKAKYYSNHKGFALSGENASKVIELAPEYYYGYQSLGFSNIQENKFQEAISNYSKAIQLNPTEKWYYQNKCYCFNQIGEYRKAIIECTKAIEMNNDFSNPYYQRGYAYKNLKQHKKSKADFKKYYQLTK